MFPLSRLRERAGVRARVVHRYEERPSSAFGTFSRKREKGHQELPSNAL